MVLSHQDVRIPRFERKGKAYVYVLPRSGEDLVKIGFSRDPFERFRTLHLHFYAFFDLQKGLLLEVDSIREARRMERLFIERWPEHRASAPFEVASHAGGHTEWFRGIEEYTDAFAHRVAERYGYCLHTPLQQWLKQRMSEYAEDLFDWSLRLLEIIDWQACNLPESSQDRKYADVLRDTLDAFCAVGVAIEKHVPCAVHRWYASQQIHPTDGRIMPI